MNSDNTLQINILDNSWNNNTIGSYCNMKTTVWEPPTREAGYSGLACDKPGRP